MLLFSRSVVSYSATPWAAARQASLSFSISWGLLKLMYIESVIPSYHLILCRPLHLLPSIFPSIRVSSNELALCIRWPKYCSFCCKKFCYFCLDLLNLSILMIRPKSWVYFQKTSVKSHFSVTSSINVRLQFWLSNEDFFFGKSLSRVWLFVTLWTIQSMEFSRPEYWSG